MPNRRFAPAAAIAAIALAGAARAAPAPGFTATDADGKAVSLAQFKGKTVVLEWTNSGCPYVNKHYGARNMQDTQALARKQGVVWLTVMSSARGKQGYLIGSEAKHWMDLERGSPTAILLDPEGKLARLYGAKTTPDMRVIDATGELVYQGGIDDKPTSDRADLKTARNLVKAALTDIAAKRPVAIGYARSYGCAIKYAES